MGAGAAMTRAYLRAETATLLAAAFAFGFGLGMLFNLQTGAI